MKARVLLLSRIEALQQDLALAKRALASTAVREDLRRKVGTLFSALIERKSNELGRLGAQVAALHDGDAIEARWAEFGRHGADCERIFREYLAFLEGALVRSAGLDDGVCEIADRFLRELARRADIEWPRFTIMAEGDFFAPMTGIIRLQYPHFSVWNLPVLAHEFGHFVAPEIKDRLAGTEPLKELRRAKREELRGLFKELPDRTREEETEKFLRHLDEFFADLFAVYASGPAYVCTCVLLRFEPGRANIDTPDHPSDAQRVHVMLHALEGLDASYGKLVQLLRKSWQGSLAAFGRHPPGTASSWLETVAGEVTHILSTNLPKARYRAEDWLRATRLGRTLNTDAWQEQASDLTPGDVLNAAWVCRLDNGEQHVSTIGSRAVKLCLAMVE